MNILITITILCMGITIGHLLVGLYLRLLKKYRKQKENNNERNR